MTKPDKSIAQTFFVEICLNYRHSNIDLVVEVRIKILRLWQSNVSTFISFLSIDCSVLNVSLVGITEEQKNQMKNYLKTGGMPAIGKRQLESDFGTVQRLPKRSHNELI